MCLCGIHAVKWTFRKEFTFRIGLPPDQTQGICSQYSHNHGLTTVTTIFWKPIVVSPQQTIMPLAQRITSKNYLFHYVHEDKLNLSNVDILSSVCYPSSVMYSKGSCDSKSEILFLNPWKSSKQEIQIG